MDPSLRWQLPEPDLQKIDMSNKFLFFKKKKNL